MELYKQEKSVEMKNLLVHNFPKNMKGRNLQFSSCKRYFKTARILCECVNIHCDERPIRCDSFENSHLIRYSKDCKKNLPHNWKVRVKSCIIVETLKVDESEKYPPPKCKRNFVN